MATDLISTLTAAFPRVSERPSTDHPAVDVPREDVVAVLRDRRDVGVAQGRPLESIGNGTWLLTNDYFATVGRPEAMAKAPAPAAGSSEAVIGGK